MKNLLKKGYENNYIFYSAGAFASLFLFFFTFKSLSDFMSRQFVEAFSLFLFLSFLTVMILELKTIFFGRNEEELEQVMAEEEEVGFEVEERTKFSDSKKNKISNPGIEKAVYEWDEVEKEESESLSKTIKTTEKEQVQEQEVKRKNTRKKAIPIRKEAKIVKNEESEEEDTPAEAAGFIPEQQDNEGPFN